MLMAQWGMRFLECESTAYYQTLWAPERVRYVVGRPQTPFYIKVFGRDLSLREAVGELTAWRTIRKPPVPQSSFYLQEVGKLEQGSLVVEMPPPSPTPDTQSSSVEIYDGHAYQWVTTCTDDAEDRIVYSAILVPADALVKKDDYILI